MEATLHHKLFSVEEIGTTHRERMFQLMAENYDNMNPDIFYKDLNNKQLAGLFFDENEELQGFTTYAVNPKSCGGKDYNIVFSGDTIISPAHWGSQVMMQSWCETIGKIIATDPVSGVIGSREAKCIDATCVAACIPGIDFYIRG